MNDQTKNAISDERDSPSALRKFVDSAAAYIYVVDFDTDEILMVNNYYAINLGVAQSRMEGEKCWKFAVGDGEGPCPYCPRDMDLDGNGVLDSEPHAVEAYNPTLGIWERCTAQAIDWVDGRKAHIMTLTDVSNEKLLREELSRLAYYDKRMNIPNRTKLEKDLTERPLGNYCVIAFDFTSLRYINDAYGRNAGDNLMQSVISWIQSFGLKDFEIYRIDGDSFCMLFDNADMISASGLADRIFERFHEPWEIVSENEDTFISCKASVCLIDGRTGFDGPEAILSIIERTLEISKERDTVAVYNQEMDLIMKRDLELEISLKNCVTGGMIGFDVYFQPIVNPQTGMWQGVEALCRWESPEFGRIPPLVFIRMAEQMGLIGTVGFWVLDRAISVCAALGLHEHEGFFLDVNLSPAQMADESLVSKVLLSLQRHGFPGENLALEVTESEEIDTTDFSQTIIERLRTLDIRMALDDFGTGYSNFNNLKSLPVGILKTEKQFIDDIVVDKYQQFLSYMLVQLAHAADMKLVAEGVETFEQMKALMKNGADFYQGYLFAKPLGQQELSDNVQKFITVDPIFEKARVEVEADAAANGVHASDLAGTPENRIRDAAKEIHEELARIKEEEEKG
jgi:EAL domain-containing protein (putative c-di-GMP-specific phosphodiesterase class I)/GGDEF domain-containing protein